MRLILALHHHQPVGQLPWTISDAVNNCYAPLLKVLLRHPSIKAALHYSGPLLEMLCAEHPLVIDQMKVLLERGQIELIGGAWWESILPIWPRDDQIAQLQLSKERLKVLFDCDPQFAWLPERVWEPQLAEILLQSDYKGTFLDDNGLLNAGVSQQDLYRVNHTAQGLKVLSIDAHLRQLIPWRSVNKIVEYLSNLHQKDSSSIAIFADDAEKFGSWPGTFQLIYEENYLDNLLTALEENGDWLQTILPSDCDDSRQTPIEIPPTSYPEMLEWSSGNWRNFLERYHESRDMYETVLRAPRTAESLPHLLKAQCNDAYWHGVFGGLYLPHLRQAIYGAAAKAYATEPKSKIEVTSSGDVILQNVSRILGIRPGGGQIFQLLDLEKNHNWSATLRLYAENYAESESPDWYARGCGIEHFLGAGATPENIFTGNFPEEGDFAAEIWRMETRQNENELIAILTRHGGVWQQGNFEPLEVKKIIMMPIQGNHWNVQYELTNSGDQNLDLWWASEWNVSPSGSDFPERTFNVANSSFNLEETHVWENVSDWQINDNWLKSTFTLVADQKFDLWQMPFRTVSRYEGETVESIFQQATIVMHRKVLLQAGQKYFCELNIKTQNQEP
jgi:alpha-amylase